MGSPVSKGGLHRRHTVEALIDRIEIAAEDLKRSKNTQLATVLSQHRHHLRKAVLRAAILKQDLWKEPQKLLDDSDFLSHRLFVSRLIGNRQPGQAAPWVFSTNYDLALEWSAEALGVHCANGFMGLHSRTFRPSSFDLGFRNVHARGEARFGAYNIYLGKLHGSLSWAIDADGGVVENASPATWRLIEPFLESEEAGDCGLSRCPRVVYL
jgi:hypothetical protein